MRQVVVVGGSLLGVLLFAWPIQAGFYSHQAGFYSHKGGGWYPNMNPTMPMGPVVPLYLTPVVQGHYVLLVHQGTQDTGSQSQSGVSTPPPRPVPMSSGVQKAIADTNNDLDKLAERINTFSQRRAYQNAGLAPLSRAKPEKDTGGASRR